MKKIAFWMIFPCFFCLPLFAEPQIQVLPMMPEEQPDYVRLQVIFPEQGSVIDEENAYIQVRLTGYSLGSVSSDLPRMR